MAELIFALTVLAAILCAWDGSGLSVYAQNSEKTRSQVRSNRVTASDGRRLFASICAGCHGLDGRGGEKGPNIVTRSEILRRSDAEILATLRHGVPTAGMPAFLSLGTANLQALTAHLRHLQGLDGNLSVSADSAGGKKLFLNVYAPEAASSSQTHGLPVMVWIHGGGFSSGQGSAYDPTPLVRENVIVVTINYRLGALGLFAHPALDAEDHLLANYALMDQQLAFKWIKNNIAAFGGDVAPFTTPTVAEALKKRFAKKK